VLSATGSSAIAGASRWLEAEATVVKPLTKAATRAALIHAKRIFMVRDPPKPSGVSLDDEDRPGPRQAHRRRLRIGPREHIDSPGAMQPGGLGVTVDHHAERLHRHRLGRDVYLEDSVARGPGIQPGDEERAVVLHDRDARGIPDLDIRHEL